MLTEITYRRSQEKKSSRVLTLEDTIQHIIGKAIGHGYQDGKERKQEPDNHCKAFANALTHELLKSCTALVDEIIGEDSQRRLCHAGCERRNAQGFACHHEVVDNEHQEQRQRLQKTMKTPRRTLSIQKSESPMKSRRVD
jgi:hypothetical protein